MEVAELFQDWLEAGTRGVCVCVWEAAVAGVEDHAHAGKALARRSLANTLSTVSAVLGELVRTFDMPRSFNLAFLWLPRSYRLTKWAGGALGIWS